MSKVLFGRTVLVCALMFGVGAIAGAKTKPPKGKTQSRAWAIVREALTSSDSAIRETAVKSLEFVENGKEVSNTLNSALDDESEYVQIWAARALAKKGNPAGKEVLLTILSKAEPEDKKMTGPLAALAKMKALARGRVRGEAAKVLGLLKDPSVTPVLKSAQRDNDGRVRDGAGVALALMGDRSETIVFESALKDQDRGVRLAAIEALEAIDDPKSEAAVRLLVNDQEEDVRNAAVRTLGGIKCADCGTVFATLLKDGSGLVRESAAWAIGEAGVKSRMTALKGLLIDPNFFVRIAAAEALGKMGDNSGLPTIEACIGSNDTDSRVKAASVLDAFDDQAAQALATKTMEDGNLKVRLGAAISILKMSQGQE